MATLDEIESPVWTYSITGGGAIAEGLTAINQCIGIILQTTPGSDPLRPTFGSNINQWQDKPLNVMIPNVKKAIIDAIAKWETRVTVSSITTTYTSDNVGNIVFNIGYKITDTNIQNSLSITVSNGGIFVGTAPQQLILRGYFPPNPNNYQYQCAFVLNGESILPLPPDTGFTSLTDMYNWIKTNWSNYGQWYITADSIVGFINPSYTTGSFAISVLTAAQFKGVIPPLPIGQKYDVQITVDGVLYETQIEGDFVEGDFADGDFDTVASLFTTGDILAWAQNQLGELGTWEILNAAGDFSTDFSPVDFDVYTQYLSITTDHATSVIINITTVNE